MNSVIDYSNDKIDYLLKKIIYHLDRIDNQIDDQNRARLTDICKQLNIDFEAQSMIALESEITDYKIKDKDEIDTRSLTI